MNTNMLTPNKLPNRGLPMHYTSKISFRDKLVGSRSPPPYSEKRDLLESRLVRIEYETGNILLSKVFVDDSMFIQLCNSWIDSLVVKLLSKDIGFRLITSRLKGI